MTGPKTCWAFHRGPTCRSWAPKPGRRRTKRASLARPLREARTALRTACLDPASYLPAAEPEPDQAAEVGGIGQLGPRGRGVPDNLEEQHKAQDSDRIGRQPDQARKRPEGRLIGPGSHVRRVVGDRLRPV